MLWFAHGADGPTWYVGKREEFGESRGWLQVKSDASKPQEIKGTWQVWSTTEKMWKSCKEGDIKCVSVSATCGVIIVGATPNNLLQDKLGEYRRVQLRVITGRGVYEMVGMPNVMMWCARRCGCPGVLRAAGVASAMAFGNARRNMYCCRAGRRRTTCAPCRSPSVAAGSGES